MIISVLNTKGGCGKTTLSVQLALTRAYLGHNVWLVDGDRQGTATQAIAQRIAAERLPAIAVSQYPDGKMLRAQVQQQRHSFEDILIDAGGRDSTALRAALMVSDVVLVPFAPRSYDLWGAADMAELANEALSVRDNLAIYAVLNQADPRGNDNAEAAEALAKLAPLVYLDSPVGRRKCLAEASAEGMSILEFPCATPEARHEIRRLTDNLFAYTN